MSARAWARRRAKRWFQFRTTYHWLKMQRKQISAERRAALAARASERLYLRTRLAADLQARRPLRSPVALAFRRATLKLHARMALP